MPTLSITKTYDDGQILTEADLDLIRTDLTTFFNTTRIDSNNIQAGGVSATNIGINDSEYLEFGTGNDGRIGVVSDDLIIENVTSDKDIIFKVNDGGVTKTLLTLDADVPQVNIGVAGTTKGVLNLAGNTSGVVTIQPAAAAGTWSLTLPANDGNSGEFLRTDGSGICSWVAGNTITEWAAYTPVTTGLGTVSSMSAFWRRTGDTLHVKMSLITGTTTANLVSFSFPSAASAGIDTAKMSVAANTSNAGDWVGDMAQPTINQFSYIVANTSTSTTVVYGGRSPLVANCFTPQNGDGSSPSSNGVQSTQLLQVKFSVPISGWVSNN